MMDVPFNNSNQSPEGAGISRFSSAQLLLASSFTFTLFLAFIDEGYYSFGWMKEMGGWIVIAIYTGLLFAVQHLLFRIILKGFPQVGRFFAVLLIALSLSLIVILSVLNH